MSEEIMDAALIATQRQRIAELEAIALTLERGWVDQVEQMLDQLSIFQIDHAQARVNDTLIPALAQMLAVLLIKDDGESFYNVIDWDIGTAGPMGQLRLTLQRLEGKTKAEIYEADAAALRAALIGWYDADNTPMFPAAERTLVALCARLKAGVDHPGTALLAELAAARALGDYLNEWVARSGRCHCCGFGRDIGGNEFHGIGCPLAAYNAAVRDARPE